MQIIQHMRGFLQLLERVDINLITIKTTIKLLYLLNKNYFKFNPAWRPVIWPVIRQGGLHTARVCSSKEKCLLHSLACCQLLGLAGPDTI
jgi:hypothetical protein